MCKKVNNTKISNTRIDKCMRKEIAKLNRERSIPSVASCCGHKKYPKTVVSRFPFKIPLPFRAGYLTLGRVTLVEYGKKLNKSLTIPRTRNFYKRDKQGYYYIPETIKND